MLDIVLVFVARHPGVHRIDQQREVLGAAALLVDQDAECPRPAVQNPRNRLFQRHHILLIAHGKILPVNVMYG